MYSINFRETEAVDYADIARLKLQVHKFHYNNRTDFSEKLMFELEEYARLAISILIHVTQRGFK